MAIAPSPVNPRVLELIRRIDEAMIPRDDASRCRGVKQVLEDTFKAGTDFLDARFLVPNPERYARRLVHRDPEGRYTVIAMVWNPGQGTPLHDHAGIWCVECVYKGNIQVTSYSCHGGDPERDLVRFEKEAVIQAGVGQAGALIPPFEYHILENADPAQPSITLHVYGGEMDHCHIFEPVGDAWVRRYRELSYTA
jgi:predicted metal-dependent enzyme (double-stranded beta helix superfamily)